MLNEQMAALPDWAFTRQLLDVRAMQTALDETGKDPQSRLILLASASSLAQPLLRKWNAVASCNLPECAAWLTKLVYGRTQRDSGCYSLLLVQAGEVNGGALFHICSARGLVITDILAVATKQSLMGRGTSTRIVNGLKLITRRKASELGLEAMLYTQADDSPEATNFWKRQGLQAVYVNIVAARLAEALFTWRPSTCVICDDSTPVVGGIGVVPPHVSQRTQGVSEYELDRFWNIVNNAQTMLDDVRNDIVKLDECQPPPFESIAALCALGLARGLPPSAAATPIAMAAVAAAAVDAAEWAAVVAAAAAVVAAEAPPAPATAPKLAPRWCRDTQPTR